MIIITSILAYFIWCFYVGPIMNYVDLFSFLVVLLVTDVVHYLIISK